MSFSIFFKNTLKVVAVIWFSQAAIANASAADKLSGADIRKLMTGTFNVSVADSVSAVAVFSAGGGISITTNKGEKDTGRWSISGNKLCVKFKRLLDRETKCSSLMNEGGAIRGTGFTARR